MGNEIINLIAAIAGGSSHLEMLLVNRSVFLFRHYRSRVAVFRETVEQRDYALWELTRLETVAKLPGSEGQGMSAREMSFSEDSPITKNRPYNTEKN